MVSDADLRDFGNIVDLLDIPSTSAQYRSSVVGMPFPASAVASVPIIQPAVAATMWSEVAGYSFSGSTL
jgi:hypothetical protein